MHAFGRNRSELFSRRGMSSSDFSFPRILGLECVGVVDDPSDTDMGGRLGSVELPEAHRLMGANEAVGKLVVLTR